MKRKGLRSLTAVTLLLAFGTALLWGACMACLTLAAAQLQLDRLYRESIGFAERVEQSGRLPTGNGEEAVTFGELRGDEAPDRLEYAMLEAIRQNSGFSCTMAGRWDTPSLLRDVSIPMRTAVLFYDGEGNLLHENGNFLVFPYVTQAVWDRGEEREGPCQYGYCRLGDGGGEEDPYARFRVMYAGTGSLYDITVLRITGAIQGGELVPRAMDYLTQGQVILAAEAAGAGEDVSISALDRAGLLEWRPQFDHRTGAETPEELTTVYALSPRMSLDEGAPLTYRGERYDSLTELTRTLDFLSWGSFAGGLAGMSEYSLDRVLCFDGRMYRVGAGDDGEAGGETAQPSLYLITAIESRPLLAAVSGLRNIYLLTGALALLLVLLLRGIIRRRLIRPLSVTAEAMEGGWYHLPPKEDRPRVWREPTLLQDQYWLECDQRRQDKNERIRLETALTYAHQAEEQRRRLISHLTHELKTPLAVIHSYAEGLQAHIAEDKREAYLSTILKETEHMDALVLEMLDLSRLEAGKVRLARDTVSLSALAEALAERFSVLAEGRELRLRVEAEGPCPAAADETRIGQAMENLVSNAVRYTPRGGEVCIRTGMGRKGVSFSVENTGPALTAEELRQVWEPFYQGQSSRSEGGTGLGLAITQTIVKLHGGTCTAHNTENGVLFGFTLPA